MATTRRTGDDQRNAWNGPSGRAWVETLDLLDEVFAPVERMLLRETAVGPGARLLDVGCGTGGTTLALARVVGPEGHAVGIDVSAQMVAAARARVLPAAAAARFVAADAEGHGFEPASFDAIVSRFGVMFFADPVRAFANLRGAAVGGAPLRFVAWRSVEENPFMTTAERAAAPLLPDLPPRKPDAPGQFAMADRALIERVLGESGWREIEIQPVDLVCTTSRDQLVRYLTWLGPVGAYLQQVDDATRRRVIESILPAFDPYLDGGELRFTAACWLGKARA
ncbi:MAG: class I SAM-dependent methyltransferase [Gemmatimonadales bacterium]